MVDGTVAQDGRICTRCGIWKTRINFFVSTARLCKPSKGMKPICKPCTSSITKELRQLDIEHFRKAERDSKKRRLPINGKKLRSRSRDHRLKYIFGITLDYFLKVLHEQNYECAICNIEIKPISDDPSKGSVACVDHDHVTRAVRGLLCNACNRGLGAFDDNPDALEAAASYLRKHGK